MSIEKFVRRLQAAIFNSLIVKRRNVVVLCVISAADYLKFLSLVLLTCSKDRLQRNHANYREFKGDTPK